MYIHTVHAHLVVLNAVSFSVILQRWCSEHTLLAQCRVLTQRLLVLLLPPPRLPPRQRWCSEHTLPPLLRSQRGKFSTCS